MIAIKENGAIKYLYDIYDETFHYLGQGIFPMDAVLKDLLEKFPTAKYYMQYDFVSKNPICFIDFKTGKWIDAKTKLRV